VSVGQGGIRHSWFGILLTHHLAHGFVRGLVLRVGYFQGAELQEGWAEIDSGLAVYGIGLVLRHLASA